MSLQEAASSSVARGKPAVQPNPLLEGLAPGPYVLRALQKVRAAELEQALLMLPFADALRLLAYLPPWLAHGSQVGRCSSVARAVAALSVCPSCLSVF